MFEETIKYNRRKHIFEYWIPKKQSFQPPKIWLFRWAYKLRPWSFMEATLQGFNPKQYPVHIYGHLGGGVTYDYNRED